MILFFNLNIYFIYYIMTDSLDTNTVSFYISIITSSLLFISEALPYINSIKYNGILETIISILQKIFKNNYQQIPQNDLIVDENKLHDSILSLIDELSSYKQIIQMYLNDKKINISISS